MNEYPQIPENGEPVTSARGVVTPVGGLLVGMLAATVCSCVDVILVAFSGKRIPWGYAPSVVGVYLVAGGLAGLILVLVQKLLYRVLPASTHDGTGIDRLQRACLIAWVTILAVPFVERLQRPFVPGFGASISTVSLVVLVAGFLASAVALVARRPAARRGDDRLFAWKVACLAMGAMMWHPFSNLYTAPALSVTSLGANAFFLGILVALYVVGRRLFRGPGDAFHSTNPARWNRRLAATAALAVGAVGVAWAVRGMVERHPIDLRRTYATSGASIDSATRPDVVLIVMDTVRADHASAYGYHRETTPNLERFARHAVRYDRAVAGSSWTLPSHATLFTGLLPTEHGAHYDEFGQGDAAYEPRPLSRNHHTLAELLLEAGYYTGAVIGNSSVVNREFGFDQGFLYFDDRDRIALDTAVPNVPVPSLWLHQAYLRLVGSDGYHYRYADQVNQSVVRWLADAPDAPLFLFINYMDPHEPYRRHAEYDDRLELEPMPRIKRCPRNAPGFAEVARRLEPYQLDNYDSELAFTDAHIGRLLDVLKRGGRYDRSLIIVTADHGEAFGEHGHRGHGTSLYEEQIHVPLMVKYPHGARYGVEPAPFSLAKLVPLLMDSLSLDGAVAGRESIPVGGAPQGAVAEVRVKPNDHANRKRTDLLRSVTRTDHLKVIESKLRPTEVYDLASDPHEAANLIEVQRAVAELTVQYLERWASNAQSVQESVDDAAPLPQSAIARLRTLGYIGPSGSPTSD